MLPWTGSVWRCHARRYSGDDASGSLKVSGRYHRGQDKFPSPEAWPALYTATSQHIALGERLRHTTAAALERLAVQRISRLRVRLRQVLIVCANTNCMETAVPGMTIASLCNPTYYEWTQALGADVVRRGAEGLLIPSCTRFRGGNLIIYPNNLHEDSSIVVDDTEDPDLFIDWVKLAVE